MREQDYLWEKEGSDTEIEKLESALSVFRYVEKVPPPLPATVPPVKTSEPRHLFRFSFAFAASLALVLAGVGISLWVLDQRAEPQDGLIVDVVRPSDVAVPIVKLSPSPKAAATNPKPNKPKFINWRKGTPTIQNKSTARVVESKQPAPRLTKEEIFAYDQLMQALAITSSKLRLVKDRIDYGNKPETDSKNNGRKLL